MGPVRLSCAFHTRKLGELGCKNVLEGRLLGCLINKLKEHWYQNVVST